MQQEIVFATNNPHKIAEIQRQMGETYTFRSLADIGCTEEVPETTATLEGNARQKARYVNERYGVDCFSEDTGLEIDALDGAPGVITAHYAGPERDAAANNQRVLSELAQRKDRTARFRTVICLLRDGQENLFEGVCEGRIATAPLGKAGFGYDPIFIPEEGDGRTFAEMSDAEKIALSHRGRALKKLVAFLSED